MIQLDQIPTQQQLFPQYQMINTIYVFLAHAGTSFASNMKHVKTKLNMNSKSPITIKFSHASLCAGGITLRIRTAVGGTTLAPIRGCFVFQRGVKLSVLVADWLTKP